MASSKSRRTHQRISSKTLPKPRRIKLADGKTRTIYYDFEGKFISKARYEELRAKSGKSPKTQKQVAPKTSLQAKQPVNRKSKRKPKKAKKVSRPSAPIATGSGSAVSQSKHFILSLSEHSLVKPAIAPEAILVAKKIPLTFHGPGSTRLSEMGIHGQEYQVVAIDPTTTTTNSVDLFPNEHYSIIPIQDEAKTSNALQRYILVRERPPFKDVATVGKSDQQAYVVVAILEPPITSEQELDSNYDHNLLIDRIQAQTVDINRLRTEILLPSLIRIEDFTSNITKTLEYIDFFYAVLALIHQGDAETLERFVTFLYSQTDVTKITSVQVYSFASPDTIRPLRLVSMHYGSPLELLVEGFPAIIKNVLDIILLKPQKEKLAIEVARQQIELCLVGIEASKTFHLPDNQLEELKDFLSHRAVELLENTLRSPDAPQLLKEAERIDFNDADLQGKQMSGLSLEGVSFLRANMTSINLSNSSLRRANLRHANLLLADLRDAKMSEASLASANLRNANLQKADLHSAQAMGASFENANLRRANLRDTNLSLANLRKADLLFADLTGADLTGADLHEAKVSREQLNLTRSLSGAIMPDGSSHPQ